MRAGEIMRRAAVALGVVLLTACGSAADTGTHVPRTASTASSALGVGVTSYPPAERPSIPDLEGTTLDGAHLALSSLRGKVVVLNVWASWCEPCRDESPLLARVAAATSGAGVRFVGIDEQDQPDAARAFAASVGTTYPHVMDPAGSLLRGLRIVPSSGIPSTLVLDRAGAVAARVIGPVDAATFQALVTSLAAPDASASP